MPSGIGFAIGIYVQVSRQCLIVGTIGTTYHLGCYDIDFMCHMKTYPCMHNKAAMFLPDMLSSEQYWQVHAEDCLDLHFLTAG